MEADEEQRIAEGVRRKLAGNRKCNTCHGTGYLVYEYNPCSYCDGKGYVDDLPSLIP